MRLVKWMLPTAAAVALLIGISTLTARAEDKAAKGSIAGTVVDKDGKAVAGVEVSLIKFTAKAPAKGAKVPANLAEEPKDAPKEKPKGDRKPVATATTDADGKFSMNDIDAGEYRVVARAKDNKGMGGERVTVTAGQQATVKITLKEGRPPKKQAQAK